ncbi:hypothetical protein [Amycolatopsis sp. Hca4]|uniref:hypothetical protein n=1 Tax=Amycolatopsis sp. Hca4 TaxID=2742131 RepID=UPI0020CB57CF|nr:hypothetical protein [Amycolatopsis sp. Hca4]
MLVIVWAALAVTLPVAVYRDLTTDVSCTSGNPVVAVWIESSSGGSGFARAGQPGSAAAARYLFRQNFAARYQIRVGCGGSVEQWGITAKSTYSEEPYRRIVCDDVHLDGLLTGNCRDGERR